VNDAPVLAQAQVSVALASGAALAQTTADVVLLGGQLSALRAAIVHARLTMRVIRQNLAWATLYNVVALPLAAFGLVTPLAAAAGMSISSLAVVANALRLLRTRGGAAGTSFPRKSRTGFRLDPRLGGSDGY
jgi:Cu2+-exporting ATPase